MSYGIWKKKALVKIWKTVTSQSLATNLFEFFLRVSLKDKGNLIFPKKYSFENQALLLLKKVNAYKYTSQRLFDVKFVPLLWKDYI